MAKKEDDLSPSYGERGRGDEAPGGSGVEDIRGIASDEDDDFDDDDLDEMEDDESEDI